jgi:hypothetical protein
MHRKLLPHIKTGSGAISTALSMDPSTSPSDAAALWGPKTILQQTFPAFPHSKNLEQKSMVKPISRGSIFYSPFLL